MDGWIGSLAKIMMVLVGVVLFFYFGILHPERCMSEIGRAHRTVHDIVSYTKAINVFRENNKKYPDEMDQLYPDYVVKIYKGGWGADYIYETDGVNQFSIVSYGADGKIGGDGASRDLSIDSEASSISDDIQSILGCRE